MTVAKDLSDFVATTEFKDIPEDVIEYTKMIMVKTVGGMLCGSTLSSSQKIMSFAKTGKEDAGVIGCGFRTSSEASLRRQITNLEGEDKKEEEAESRAFRLSAHAQVSEQVFEQEVGSIRARRRWLEEERSRLGKQLADIERLSFSPDAVESLRRRFEERLARATPEDKRFVLESLGAKVIAHPDGTWDMEIELPRQVQSDLQIAHSRPESNSTRNMGSMLRLVFLALFLLFTRL